MKYFDADAQTLKPMTVDANYNWRGQPIQTPAVAAPTCHPTPFDFPQYEGTGRNTAAPVPAVADDPATDAFLRSAIQRIEFGLGEATKDNITSVTIDGVTWIRKDTAELPPATWQEDH